MPAPPPYRNNWDPPPRDPDYHNPQEVPPKGSSGSGGWFGLSGPPYPRTEEDKVLAGLAHLFGWLVSLIVVLAKGDDISPWLGFHCKQVIARDIAFIPLYSIVVIASFVVICLFPLLMIFILAYYAAIIYGAVMAFQGNEFEYPYLGKYIRDNFMSRAGF